MNKKMIIILIATCIISYVLFTRLNSVNQKQPLSEADVQAHIDKLYAGEVKSIVMQEDIAVVSFATQEGIYQVNINLENSRPSNLAIVHQFVGQTDDKEVAQENLAEEESASKPSEQQTAKPEQNNNQNKNYLISEQQAIQIALKEQAGVVDNVDFKKTDDGGIYEIDIEHGDYETTFIIHAITGKILSVEFDD
ncbi:PepSY domain-containing protein [Metasolibacillus fluoroglycofenilyticus]|uniref:PepSY domain-containing protein n=1 Tax=Metasolibacillus fluoroglycofenilyticus TaxID=1239396 RepID=UPI000D3BA1F4|nr:PepSY domain-containing protein [Metasolibacillus fluoroglycofenilyticus]